MKPKVILKPIHVCPHDDTMSFSISRFDDVVNCNYCGALYYIGSDIINPIAKIEIHYEKD